MMFLLPGMQKNWPAKLTQFIAFTAKIKLGGRYIYNAAGTYPA